MAKKLVRAELLAWSRAFGKQAHLDRPRTADLDEYVAAARRSKSLHHPWVYPPYTRMEYQNLLKRARSVETESFFVRSRQDGGLAGVINLSQIYYGAFENCYTGFYAFEPYAGKGLMADGLTLVLIYAFDLIHLHRVEANIQPDNERSKALARRCGFVMEGYSQNYLRVGGQWKDHERWAIRREILPPAMVQLARLHGLEEHEGKR